MFKFYKKFSIFIALLVTCFVFQTEILSQEKEKIVSGDYESLTLGVDSKGVLTGYFSEGTGDDGEGNPQFTCKFFIYGTKDKSGIYKIKTWYPEFPDEVVGGILKFSEVGIKKGVNITLDGEHGGCANVAPQFKEESGIDFSLSTAGDWQSVRMISAKRVWLFKSIDAGAPQKIYVDKNDAVKVFQTKKGWAEIRYSNADGRTAYGWMKVTEFYGLKPKK